jgi:hypothetical protein
MGCLFFEITNAIAFCIFAKKSWTSPSWKLVWAPPGCHNIFSPEVGSDYEYGLAT